MRVDSPDICRQGRSRNEASYVNVAATIIGQTIATSGCMKNLDAEMTRTFTACRLGKKISQAN